MIGHVPLELNNLLCFPDSMLNLGVGNCTNTNITTFQGAQKEIGGERGFNDLLISMPPCCSPSTFAMLIVLDVQSSILKIMKQACEVNFNIPCNNLQIDQVFGLCEP